LQSAARIICAPAAHKFHTCSLRSIFFAAHVAEENDWAFFAPAGAKATRFLDKLMTGAPKWERRSYIAQKILYNKQKVVQKVLPFPGWGWYYF
jgi:hypothetical protein